MPVDPLMLLKSRLCLSGVRRRTLHLCRTISFHGDHHRFLRSRVLRNDNLCRTSSLRGEYRHGSRHRHCHGDHHRFLKSAFRSQVKVPTRVARTPEEGRQVFRAPGEDLLRRPISRRTPCTGRGAFHVARQQGQPCRRRIHGRSPRTGHPKAVGRRWTKRRASILSNTHITRFRMETGVEPSGTRTILNGGTSRLSCQGTRTMRTTTVGGTHGGGTIPAGMSMTDLGPPIRTPTEPSMMRLKACQEWRKRRRVRLQACPHRTRRLSSSRLSRTKSWLG
mmetsp:Transcript_28401/g.74974  ORF Transcript_28401/g.74974 Transcript_28401/m.74974 type:complete len:278 (-) Transcript_28401:2341-3174(-)